MERYIRGDKIGEGSFGRVYKAQEKTSKRTVALKIISKLSQHKPDISRLREECEIQKNLKHDNIIMMLDYFETPENIIVVTELALQDLSVYLKRYKRLEIDQMKMIAYDVTSALHYLHHLRILHRDIKPQNVLMCLDGRAKLCDFGFARTMGVDTYMLTSIKGTPLYMAPEIMQNQPYDHLADLWSLGCILYELVVGVPPFSSTSLLCLMRKIQNEVVVWPSILPNDCKSFLEGLLQKDPKNRMAWTSILIHPFMRDYFAHMVKSPSTEKYPLTAALSPSQEDLKKAEQLRLQKKLNSLSKKLADTVKSIEQTNKNFQKCNHKPRKKPDAQKRPEKGKAQLAGKKLGEDSDTESASSCETLTSSSSSADCSSDDGQTIIVETNSRETRFDEHYKRFANSSSSNPQVAAMKNLRLDNEGKFNGACVLWKANAAAASGNGGDSTPMETEEWIYFVKKTMREVQETPASLCEKHFLSVLVAPLRNRNAHPEVIEKIAVLLAIPYILLQDNKKDLTSVQNLYYESKVLPNLLRASQLIVKKKIDALAASSNVEESKDKAVSDILEQMDFDGLDKCMRLITFLSYVKKEFAYQLCESVFVLEAIPLFLLYLTLHKRHPRLTLDTLSVLCQILRLYPADLQMVEILVLRFNAVTNDGILLLLTNENPSIVSKAMRMLAHLFTASAQVKEKCILPRRAKICAVLDKQCSSSDAALKQAIEILAKKLGHTPSRPTLSLDEIDVSQ